MMGTQAGGKTSPCVTHPDPVASPERPRPGLKKSRRIPLLVLNILLVTVGIGGSILNRIYFLHGGQRIWVASLLQNVGFPVCLVPLSVLYALRSRGSGPEASKLVLSTPLIAAASAALGVLGALTGFFYSHGSSYLPVSTSYILSSTQVAFTALFAFLMVRQRLTPYIVNAVVLLVVGAVVLGLRASSDRPEGESDGHYYLGFFMALGAAVLYGLTLPLVELMYSRIEQRITYTLVLEIEMLIAAFASAFCLVAMAINNDFKAMAREAEEYELGRTKYILILVFSSIVWQCFGLGSIGVIYCSSSMLSGIVLAVLIPVGEVAVVVLLSENFNSAKGLSLFLALWGFASYLYGERQQMRKEKANVTLSSQDLQQQAALP